MKRVVCGLLTVYLLLMCGCSGSGAQENKSIMYVIDGAYNLTPQEYIDLVNHSIEDLDEDYPTIPDWNANATVLEIYYRFIELSLETSDQGKITDIRYQWEIKDQKHADAAYFMAGLTIGMIVGPENLQSVYDVLEMTKTGVSSYENECDQNGSHFYFTSYGHGKYNNLHIHPNGD